MPSTAKSDFEIGLRASLWGGSLVSRMGITDLVLSWTRTAAEREKFLAEKDKLAAETRKLEAETRKILIENSNAKADAKAASADLLCSAAHERLVESSEARERSTLAAPSALLTEDEIRSQAKLYGISSALAAHLLNRVLPTVADATRSYPQAITSSPNRSQRTAAAGY